MGTLKGKLDSNCFILIKPSKQLVKYIENLQEQGMPPRLKSFFSKQEITDTFNCHDLTTISDDYEIINSAENELNASVNFTDVFSDCEISTFSMKEVNKGCLRITDLLWLNKILEMERKNGKMVYLHELLKGSNIMFPENEKMERNPELEKRCEKLRHDLDNAYYKNMTKNVDSVRKRLPEDTIAYQLKQLNKQLIAVLQFVVSVATGFAFGFIGIELMIGNLDYGFRLLLGIMCALIIALAELYFLAKQLNEFV